MAAKNEQKKEKCNKTGLSTRAQQIPDNPPHDPAIPGKREPITKKSFTQTDLIIIILTSLGVIIALFSIYLAHVDSENNLNFEKTKAAVEDKSQSTNAAYINTEMVVEQTQVAIGLQKLSPEMDIMDPNANLAFSQSSSETKVSQKGEMTGQGTLSFILVNKGGAGTGLTSIYLKPKSMFEINQIELNGQVVNFDKIVETIAAGASVRVYITFTGHIPLQADLSINDNYHLRLFWDQTFKPSEPQIVCTFTTTQPLSKNIEPQIGFLTIAYHPEDNLGFIAMAGLVLAIISLLVLYLHRKTLIKINARAEDVFHHSEDISIQLSALIREDKFRFGLLPEYLFSVKKSAERETYIIFVRNTSTTRELMDRKEEYFEFQLLGDAPVRISVSPRFFVEFSI